MNAIMLVFFFLMLITFSTSALFDHLLSTSRIKYSYEAYLDALHSLRNDTYKKSYSSHKTHSKNSAPNAKKKSRDKSKYISFRLQINDSRKLNLHSLLKKDNQLLFTTAANVIYKLYSHSPLFLLSQEREEPLHIELTKAFIEAARSCDSSSWELEKLQLKDPQLHTIWYQMLKGSPDEDDREGWRSLTDYFLIDKERDKALYFQKASPILLESFFGEEVSDKILSKERENYGDGRNSSAITKSELFQIITASQFVEHKKHLETKATSKKETSINKLRSTESRITAKLLAPASSEPSHEEEEEKDETLSPRQAQMSPKFSPHASRLSASQ